MMVSTYCRLMREPIYSLSLYYDDEFVVNPLYPVNYSFYKIDKIIYDSLFRPQIHVSLSDENEAHEEIEYIYRDDFLKILDKEIKHYEVPRLYKNGIIRKLEYDYNDKCFYLL